MISNEICTHCELWHHSDGPCCPPVGAHCEGDYRDEQGAEEYASLNQDFDDTRIPSEYMLLASALSRYNI